MKQECRSHHHRSRATIEGAHHEDEIERSGRTAAGPRPRFPLLTEDAQVVVVRAGELCVCRVLCKTIVRVFGEKMRGIGIHGILRDWAEGRRWTWNTRSG